LPPGTVQPPVEETAFETLEQAISTYSSEKHGRPANTASEQCLPVDFYIENTRKLQVGFRGGNGLSAVEQDKLVRIAALALDTTLTNYGFSGAELPLVSSTQPYYVCVKGSNSPLNTQEFFAEMGPFDKDKGFYRQAKDQFANMFVERIRTNADNYSEVHFWFDEGLSNFAGDNFLIGSADTWRDNLTGSLPNPMNIEALPNAQVGSPSDPSSNYFVMYPYYATTIAFFESDTGLGLDRSDFAAWLQKGVELNSFSQAFNALNLGANAPGGAVTYSQLKTNIVSLVADWLALEGSTTALTDWTGEAISDVVVQRKPDWQFAPVKGFDFEQSGTTVTFDSLVYTFADDNYDLYFRTASACYGGLQLSVVGGKAATAVSTAGAVEIDCSTIPL